MAEYTDGVEHDAPSDWVFVWTVSIVIVLIMSVVLGTAGYLGLI